MDNLSNGNIIASIMRTAGKGNCWSMKARGYYTKATNTCEDMEPIIRGVMKNKMQGVKILKPGENGTEHGWQGPKTDRNRGGGNDDCCCIIF